MCANFRKINFIAVIDYENISTTKISVATNCCDIFLFAACYDESMMLLWGRGEVHVFFPVLAKANGFNSSRSMRVVEHAFPDWSGSWCFPVLFSQIDHLDTNVIIYTLRAVVSSSISNKDRNKGYSFWYSPEKLRLGNLEWSLTAVTPAVQLL